MIFNGIEKEYIRVHIDLLRPPTPPIEFNTTPIRGGGSRTRKKRFTDLILPVPVTIYGNPTIEDLNEDLTKWLVHEEPKKLSFKDRPDRYYLAEYESMDLDERKYRAKGTINFYLAQGYRFGADELLNLTDVMSPFNIKGQVETPWKSKTIFTVPQSQFFIRGYFGRNITLNYNFIAGDVLEIDYETRDIFLNGNDLAVALSLESNWFDLPTGNVYLRASHPTELVYTERYY